MEEARPLIVPECVRELFSSIAPRYDLLNTVLSLGTDRRWRREAVRFLAGYGRVLDLCAGTLALTSELLKVSPESEITALDFSDTMLTRGVAGLRPEWRPRVRPVLTDFFDYPVDGDPFDAIMCAWGVRNLVDNRRAIAKAFSVLRPGGRLVILEFFRPDRFLSRLFQATYAKICIPAFGRFVSRHKQAYRHLSDTIRGFFTLDEYEGLLRERGFTVTHARRLTGGITGLIVADKGGEA
jgi:ubiquinone/menaquinone biosynthesis methyltransferase